MEHRWGHREEVARTVLLVVRRRSSSPEVMGVLRNVSASGAYVETAACIPLLAQVDVQLDAGRVEACAVRLDAQGIGLEWSEFAPPAVMALFRQLTQAPGTTLPGTAASPGTTPAYAADDSDLASAA